MSGNAALDQVDDVRLGEHTALGCHVVELAVVPGDLGTTSSGGKPTLIMHLSMVAPVPDAHLSFIDGTAILSPVFSSVVNMMILASWPPSSTTLPQSGCIVSTARVTAFTSCTNLAPRCGARGAAPDPVMNTRQLFLGVSGK